MKLTLISEESDESLMSSFRTSQAPSATPPLKISQLGLDQKMDLLQEIKALIDPALVKYTKYFVIQVASGHLPVDRMRDDAPMLNKTIAGFIKHARKGDWKKSKNIYDFPNWRILSDDVIELEATNTDFTEKGGDAKVIFSQDIPNDHGINSRYWLRKLLTVKGAYKYGRGTQWCTASDPTQFANPDHNPAVNYLKNGELYIVEMQRVGTEGGQSRKPLVQLYFKKKQQETASHSVVYEIMGPQNREVTRFGPKLARFLRNALKEASSEMSPECIETLSKYVRIAKPVYVPREPNLDGDWGPMSFCFDGTRSMTVEVATFQGEVWNNFTEDVNVLIISQKLSDDLKVILRGVTRNLGGMMNPTDPLAQRRSKLDFEWPSDKIAAAAKYNVPIFSVVNLQSVLMDPNETDVFYRQVNEPDDEGAYPETLYLGPLYEAWQNRKPGRVGA